MGIPPLPPLAHVCRCLKYMRLFGARSLSVLIKEGFGKISQVGQVTSAAFQVPQYEKNTKKQGLSKEDAVHRVWHLEIWIHMLPRSLRQAKKNKRKCQHLPTQKKAKAGKKIGTQVLSYFIAWSGKETVGRKKSSCCLSQTTQMALETKLPKGFCDEKKITMFDFPLCSQNFCDNTVCAGRIVLASDHTQKTE